MDEKHASGTRDGILVMSDMSNEYASVLWKKTVRVMKLAIGQQMSIKY